MKIHNVKLKKDILSDLGLENNIINECYKFDIGDFDNLIKLSDSIDLSSFHELVLPPFNKCYFEFKINEVQTISTIVIFKNNELHFYYFKIKQNKMIDTCAVSHVCFVFQTEEHEIIRSHPYTDEHRKETFCNISVCFMKLFNIMACSNVETKNVETTQQILVSKKGRMKKVKKFFNHKILVIKLPNNRENGQSHDGTHLSPRLHFRRGHIRKLKSGITTWVQSCMVGDIINGLGEKEYKVSS